MRTKITIELNEADTKALDAMALRLGVVKYSSLAPNRSAMATKIVSRGLVEDYNSRRRGRPRKKE